MEQTQILENLDHTHSSCAEILWIVSNRPPAATHLHYNLLLNFYLTLINDIVTFSLKFGFYVNMCI